MILRIERKPSNFVTIHKDMLLDINLSWKAKGILAHMLTRPDDWKFWENEIASNCKDGIKSTRTGIKELITQKYIERKRIRVNNKFNGYEYIVRDYSPLCQIRKMGKGKTQGGTLLNNNVTNNDVTNKIIKGIFKENTNACLIIEYFLDKYQENRVELHPNCKKEYWLKNIGKLAEFNQEWFGESELDVDAFYELIDRFFQTNLDSDYNFAHFACHGILECGFYEKLY